MLTWIVLLAALGHRGVQGWINFRVKERPDRNDGHTSIDFGGQWMMGRLLVLGYGREMYSRQRHLEVARKSFSRDREAPGATEHDAERLVGYYPGPPDDPVGGPLYPPIHAFVMAPLGLIADPYVAYRIDQGISDPLGFARRGWRSLLIARPMVVVGGDRISASISWLPRRDRPRPEQSHLDGLAHLGLGLDRPRQARMGWRGSGAYLHSSRSGPFHFSPLSC